MCLEVGCVRGCGRDQMSWQLQTLLELQSNVKGVLAVVQTVFSSTYWTAGHMSNPAPHFLFFHFSKKNKICGKYYFYFIFSPPLLFFFFPVFKRTIGISQINDNKFEHLNTVKYPDSLALISQGKTHWNGARTFLFLVYGYFLFWFWFDFLFFGGGGV